MEREGVKLRALTSLECARRITAGRNDAA